MSLSKLLPLVACFVTAAHAAPPCEELLTDYVTIESGRSPIKAWIRGVPMDDSARNQLLDIARLPFIFSHVAVMPDVHAGLGATVGSVIATKGAVIPGAVGTDIGCGMMAVETQLRAEDLPQDLSALRAEIEAAVPHGGVGASGGWQTHTPNTVTTRWRKSGLEPRLAAIVAKNPKISSRYTLAHLGTLGGGNHFIEIETDEKGFVWVMVHTGSRGIGYSIGQAFIDHARKKLPRRPISYQVSNRDLAWLEEGEPEFEDYLQAAEWAQDYAKLNREIIMDRILMVLRKSAGKFQLGRMSVHSHHNYISREHHFGEEILVARKGAVRAEQGEPGVIPGSMGARSYIVTGKGNPQSFKSCSHGAGRIVSRGDARQLFTLEDHIAATEGVECRKDQSVIAETPGAYKDIDAVMAAQTSLVEVVRTLKQILVIKGE